MLCTERRLIGVRGTNLGIDRWRLLAHTGCEREGEEVGPAGQGLHVPEGVPRTSWEPGREGFLQEEIGRARLGFCGSVAPVVSWRPPWFAGLGGQMSLDQAQTS